MFARVPINFLNIEFQCVLNTEISLRLRVEADDEKNLKLIAYLGAIRNPHWFLLMSSMGWFFEQPSLTTLQGVSMLTKQILWIYFYV